MPADCCGLTRQVSADLMEDFGFKLGRWNQAYQYDTLRGEQVNSHEELEPGDLVFIRGTYKNENSKPQRYDIVHVEVFLGDSEYAGDHRGTGEATIGARWQKGEIQIFPSYAFEAKSYHIHEYIYCKVDSWLQGVCQPRDDHWRSAKWIPGSKSLFSDNVEDEAQDEDGGEVEREAKGAPPLPDDASVKMFYVSEGNQWDLIASSLTGRSEAWWRMPFNMRRSSQFLLKWTESVSGTVLKRLHLIFFSQS